MTISMEDRIALEELNLMVSTPGWKILSESIDKKIEAIKEELTAPVPEMNEYLLRIAQGRLLAYRDILSVPGQTTWALTAANEIQED